LSFGRYSPNRDSGRRCGISAACKQNAKPDSQQASPTSGAKWRRTRRDSNSRPSDSKRNILVLHSSSWPPFCAGSSCPLPVPHSNDDFASGERPQNRPSVVPCQHRARRTTAADHSCNRWRRHHQSRVRRLREDVLLEFCHRKAAALSNILPTPSCAFLTAS
jgi:hypothetical protein